ncbi:hypothetical protein [Methylocella silvestris]|uniref:Uncharacterized protein n=1 Tax=Methylocella silvestris TaxID=199596 RepID=A0A2J7TFQ6_METSI|nr:hypothetical protein [Methylocella silvestris]PNG25598.1 hypothetical protein CR492_12800 [Methylocella silvestris]
MIQQEKAQDTQASQGPARDLLSRLYREIGISAVAAALESNKRIKAKPADAGQNPAVIRDEKAA